MCEPTMEGPHLVWMDASGAEIYLGGEDDFTDAFVNEQALQLVLAVNKGATRIHPVTRYYPFLDAAPHEQEPGMKRNAGQAVADLVQALEAGRRVGVHCRSGIHRSTSVVMAALALRGSFPNRNEAYRHIAKIRYYARHHHRLAKWVEAAGRDELRYRAERRHP